MLTREQATRIKTGFAELIGVHFTDIYYILRETQAPGEIPELVGIDAPGKEKMERVCKAIGELGIPIEWTGVATIHLKLVDTFPQFLKLIHEEIDNGND